MTLRRASQRKTKTAVATTRRRFRFGGLDDVKAFYDARAVDEWDRLHKDPYRQLEEFVTLHFLDAHLPKPEGGRLVLDAGCGPGRYSITLAKSGYDLVLLDLAPQMLAQAKQRAAAAGVAKKIRALHEGSVDDLARFADDTFDAVLCLGGPLSHVLDEPARKRAAAELVRVAKPGAPIFAGVIGRLALLRGMLTSFPHLLPDAMAQLASGDYAPRDPVRDGFTAAHWFLPEELRALFEPLAVDVVTLAGLEGLSARHEAATNALARSDPKGWRAWLEVLLATCTHPAAVGASEHILLVARKKKAKAKKKARTTATSAARRRAPPRARAARG